jgi:putative ABC transport system permease protein
MLLVARTVNRHRELGIRAALGASRIRLARQLAVESLVLSLSASCLGLLLARWCATFVTASLSTQAYSVVLDLTLDWRVVGFTACVGVVVALLFGIASGLVATQTDPLNLIRPRQVPGTGTFGFGNATVLVQVALSVMLLAGMGLFVRTFFALSQASLGFESERVLVVTVERSDTSVDVEPDSELHQRVLESVTRLPAVESAAYSLTMPGGTAALTPWIELADGTALPQGPSGVYANRVGPEWFRTLGTRVLAGRSIEVTDNAGSTPVAVVNEAFVRQFLDTETAIGTRLLERSSPDAPRRQLQIVGVVEDAMYRFVRESPPPTVYMAVAQAVDDPPRTLSLSVRARGPRPGILSRDVATAISDVDRSLSLTFRTLSDQVSAQFARERLVATVASFFGVLALVLAAVGLYGLTAFMTAQRRFELGVRLALGASPRSVVRHLLRRLATPVVAGLGLGILGILWAGPLVRSLLFGVEPTDGATVATSSIVLLVVAAVAIWLPARRAARVDLARLLRDA